MIIIVYPLPNGANCKKKQQGNTGNFPDDGYGLTQMMADESNFLCSEIQNHIAEADADSILVPGKLELHGRCRYGVLLSPCCAALYLSQI